MSRPNILIVLTDQQRADTIGALGNPLINTPTCDRLCREGTAFTDCSTPSPVCVPARCCLATGHLPQTTGVVDNSTPWQPDTRTIYQQASDAGYRTHAVGKCHFIPDTNWGFHSREYQDEIGAARSDDYRRDLAKAGYEWCLEPHGMRGDWYYLPQPSQLPAALHPTTWVADRSCAFINQQAKKTSKSKGKSEGESDQPWLLATHFIHPHPPFSPPYPHSRQYRSHHMPAPITADNDVSTWVNRQQNRYKWRDAGWDANLYRTMKAAYYSCISYIDEQLARIIAVLEATNQLDNTLIIFTSDHGEHLGDLGFVGKRSFHDAALRVPLLVRYPQRFAAGARCAAPTSLVDIAATLAAVGGWTPDPDAPGVDLAALAQENANQTGHGHRHVRHQPVTSHLGRGNKAQHCLVEADWKYAWSAGDGREYLFDRQADPQDRRNLSDDPDLQDLKQRLQQTLRGLLPDGRSRHRHLARLSADCPARGSRPRPVVSRPRRRSRPDERHAVMFISAHIAAVQFRAEQFSEICKIAAEHKHVEHKRGCFSYNPCLNCKDLHGLQITTIDETDEVW